MKILIKFATRDRANIFINTLNQYIDYLSKTIEYEIIISADNDDLSMRNKSIINYIQSIKNTKIYYSDRKTKIEALNRDIEKANNDWQIILSGSDDMIPIVKNYNIIICNYMKKYFPDTDGILWFWDGHRKDMIEFFAMGRKYYNRFGYVYYPGYKSMRADAEMTEVAKKLNKVKYIDKVIMEHRHHSFKKINSIPKDNLHIENHKPLKEDYRIYDKRKAANFYLC